MTEVSGNQVGTLDDLMDLAKMQAEPLDEELKPYLGESETMEWPLLRHPLVYQVPYYSAGHANRALRLKRKALDEAVAEGRWGDVINIHERPYRLGALIDYCTGWDEAHEPIPLRCVPQWWDLAAYVWTDSENIEQRIEDWRLLFDNGEGLWLGGPGSREVFDALPKVMLDSGPHIHAWRGGSVGDWSWTVNPAIARFFSRRSGLPVRGHLIPVSDVFGYLTNRSESELLVKFTEFRASLVYPNGTP